MRQIIIGAILVVWGLAIVVSPLIRETHGGAYGAGQMIAWLVGVVMVVAGARAVLKAREARG
jgi:hypothetical protein